MNWLTKTFRWLWDTLIVTPVIFVTDALKEENGHTGEGKRYGGKTSYSRILGVYIVYSIIDISQRGETPPEMLWMMFMVVIGYQLLSKGLSKMSPAMIDIAKAMLLKVQGSQPKAPTP